MTEQTELQGVGPNARLTKQEAAQSVAAKSLTKSQFEESWAIAGVMENAIHKSGAFKDKLGDYAYAFARLEKFAPMKGEMIIRDTFKARYGQTMNDMRETLKERENALGRDAKDDALKQAYRTESLIRDGETMPFYKAFDQSGSELGERLGVTDVAAKKLMSDAYQNAEGRELYASGKALEKEHHQPRTEAERKQGNAEDWPPRTQSRAR